MPYLPLAAARDGDRRSRTPATRAASAAAGRRPMNAHPVRNPIVARHRRAGRSLILLASDLRDRARDPAGGDPAASTSRSRTVNRWQPGEQFGRTGAGLIARIPFIDRIVWVDKRVLDVDLDNQPVLSTDQLRLEVDAFARFRVVDPLQMVRHRAAAEDARRRPAPPAVRLGAAQRARQAAVRRVAQPRARRR